MSSDTTFRPSGQALINLGDEAWAGLVAVETNCPDGYENGNPAKLPGDLNTKPGQAEARAAWREMHAEFNQVCEAYAALADLVRDPKYLAALVVAQCDREHGNSTANCGPACQVARDTVRD